MQSMHGIAETALDLYFAAIPASLPHYQACPAATQLQQELNHNTLQSSRTGRA